MDNTLPITPVAQIIGGLLILFLGRRLFWVFVGVIGFFCGMQFGMQLFADMAPLVLLALSMLVGVICAGLAVLLQRLAVCIAGGFAGGVMALQLAPNIGLHSEAGVWVAFIVGALLTAVMLSVLFDPVLILLSSLVGAVMITGALSLDDAVAPFVFGICAIVGIAVQSRMFSRERAASS